MMAIAQTHGLMVIEDAAHAHGARYNGRPAGSLGHMASFSFQSSKNLTAGEGGIITTNDRRRSPRRADRFTTAAAFPTASGTSTTSSPATTGSANCRARC